MVLNFVILNKNPSQALGSTWSQWIHTYPKMIEACMDTITTTSGMNKDVKTIGHSSNCRQSKQKFAGCSNTKESLIYDITIGWMFMREVNYCRDATCCRTSWYDPHDVKVPSSLNSTEIGFRARNPLLVRYLFPIESIVVIRSQSMGLLL